ncbi:MULTISPECIES: type III secretion system inner membrane ring lipoprotein SctJ [Mesorhizobium]|uniref:Lipoprotein n=1 Tax=Mesorhizobium neociceri TaxID=1307853 RepID=A0A838BB47_9HYPH|nr:MULTISPECIES: type III secretion inner membrane ring lipoprotein SctJ [Mesorhizobium]MBA1143898.1 type III secretion inner membrane ring lipoprotein SctJ [Mesorhizobium neociceri]
MINAGGRLTSVLTQLATFLGLFTLVSCAAKTELYRDLPAQEANEMLALLMRKGVNIDKTIGNNGTASLVVDTMDVPRAMEVLNRAGLPRELYADMGSLFKKEGMISSPTEERVRYTYGITQELSRTLSGIDGVVNSRVHVVLPEMSSDDRIPSFPSSAAVLVRYLPSATVDQIVPKIKELVANSLEGLSYDKVSVILIEATQDNALRPPVYSADPPTKDSGASRLVIVLSCAIAVLLAGNAILVFLLWRRFHRTSAITAHEVKPMEQFSSDRSQTASSDV